MWGVGGGLVGGQEVDEEFQASMSHVGSAESDGGADVEAVEDVDPLAVGVPVAVLVEALGNEAGLEVEGRGEGEIEAAEGRTEVGIAPFAEVEFQGDGQADRPVVEALSWRCGTIGGVEHQAAAVGLDCAIGGLGKVEFFIDLLPSFRSSADAPQTHMFGLSYIF